MPLRIANVINGLGQPYRHTIVSLDGCYDSCTALNAGVAVDRLQLAGPGGGSMAMVRFASRQLRTLTPDFLATYNWGAIEWALANTLFVRGLHVHFESGFGPEEADGQIARRVYMRRLALLGASRLVVPSRVLERIARGVWKLPQRKVLFVPNGVDVERYARAPVAGIPPGFERRDNELIIGTVAPLRREKNVARLIREFAQIVNPVRPVRLLIVGDGVERPALETLARHLGVDDRVFFAGHVDRVEQVVGWMDVFALSSDTEQMPNALIQAMAASRAIASVDVGDVGIVVDPTNYPYIVPRDEPGALARAITQLLASQELRATVGSANHERVKREYDFARMVSTYRAIYDDPSAPTGN